MNQIYHSVITLSTLGLKQKMQNKQKTCQFQRVVVLSGKRDVQLTLDYLSVREQHCFVLWGEVPSFYIVIWGSGWRFSRI